MHQNISPLNLHINVYTVSIIKIGLMNSNVTKNEKERITIQTSITFLQILKEQLCQSQRYENLMEQQTVSILKCY